VGVPRFVGVPRKPSECKLQGVSLRTYSNVTLWPRALSGQPMSPPEMMLAARTIPHPVTHSLNSTNWTRHDEHPFRCRLPRPHQEPRKTVVRVACFQSGDARRLLGFRVSPPFSLTRCNGHLFRGRVIRSVGHRPNPQFGGFGDPAGLFLARVPGGICYAYVPYGCQG